MINKFESGVVLRYPYLWRWQKARNETEGRKHRPVCLAISVHNSKDGLTHLALLAISSQPPSDPANAIEIPEIERRRGGLSERDSAWISISEYNYDILEKCILSGRKSPAAWPFQQIIHEKNRHGVHVLVQDR